MILSKLSSDFYKTFSCRWEPEISPLPSTSHFKDRHRHQRVSCCAKVQRNIHDFAYMNFSSCAPTGIKTSWQQAAMKTCSLICAGDASGWFYSSTFLAKVNFFFSATSPRRFQIISLARVRATLTDLMSLRNSSPSVSASVFVMFKMTWFSFLSLRTVDSYKT